MSNGKRYVRLPNMVLVDLEKVGWVAKTGLGKWTVFMGYHSEVGPGLDEENHAAFMQALEQYGGTLVIEPQPTKAETPKLISKA